MKSYKHIGAQALVLEDGRKERGDVFEAEFPESYEAFLLRAGIVELVPAGDLSVPQGFDAPWIKHEHERVIPLSQFVAPELDAPAPKKKG